MGHFNTYLKALQGHSIAEITEHTHRPALQQLLESIATKSIKILHEPKRDKTFGAPDFKISTAEAIIGYIENKGIEENLEKLLKSPQLKKYQQLSNNLLLTNYREWIWVRDGKIQQQETLFTLADIENKKATLNPAKEQALQRLIEGFFSYPPRQIADAKKLAEALALRAKLLKDFMHHELERQKKGHTEGKLYQLYETFKQFVFNELTVAEFADAFAQNLVYGLFLAKLNADAQPVNLYNAKKYIPQAFELIRELVDFLDELDNPEYSPAKWIVEEVLSIMQHLDLAALQQTLSFNTRRKDADGLTIKDPYVYFYEDFLAAYDKKLREAKGVYYTPPPVVNFIVRAIDDVLTQTFGIKEGLADRKRVTVLDFATGTGTFLVEILQQIFDKIPPQAQAKKQGIIKEHILKNLYGFEYLIAPYTIAHLKLSQYLKDNGYTLKNKERLQVYLTNTLEPVDKQVKIPLLPALTQESRDAQRVKDTPILVITGNPPYSGHSKNNGAWISEKIRDYYFVDGHKLGEKNPKWLQDDYVKFIRFAQDKIDSVEEGVVGIITNHRFLTNPTFRGMRQSLMKTFDQMYFIDLHGSNKPKEYTPDGGKDENVFDIEQGVAISILVKKKGLEKKIYHTDFWGKRLDKYKQSLADSLSSIEWKELKPSAPYYLLKEIDRENNISYEKGILLNSIFFKSSVGIATSRDSFVIDFEEDKLLERIDYFLDEKNSINSLKKKYNLKEGTKFKIKKSREKLNKLSKSELESLVYDYHYRVFDVRKLIYDDNLLERPRKEVMTNLMGSNFAIIANRQVKSENYSHAFATKLINDLHIIETAYANPYTFPLYYISENSENLFYDDKNIPQSKWNVNFTKEFTKLIKEKYSSEFSPEEIMGYLYAVLHSPTYREKYAEFLKIDFPRIPFTDSEETFQHLSALGSQLIAIHLMEEETIDQLPNSGIELIGDPTDTTVTKPQYIAEKEQLWINDHLHYTNIKENIFHFRIGGYQVVDKYLKDRKKRQLDIDEQEHVIKIAKIIARTIKLMDEIDENTKAWI